MDSPQRFTDFADEKDSYPLEGTKKKLNEILNLEVLITGYRLAPSKVNGGKYLTIQFEIDGETHIVFTGSEVLANQMERYKGKLPYYAKVIKRDRYYSLS